MHSHTTAGMAVAAQEQGLLPLNQMSMQFFGRTSYHDYEGIALDLDERERLVRDLGDNNAMILRHHGLLTTGRTVGDAFYEMYYLEQACRLQVAATQGGQRVVAPPDSVAEHAARQFESFESKGQRPWAALKRRLGRESPDYAT
jgi:ribulose-5-phosphate 4-epimerase/fuculose-1-phosphate aldolase